jgi:drug/metabolite transporter (DMT)-like permease
VNLYGTGGALIGACVVVLSSGAYVTVASADDWFWLILMGLVGGCAVLALVTAYRMTAPSSLAPFEYVGIPISFAIGWVIFNEAPFERLWPGALLIVAGGLLIVWRQHHNARHKVDP